MPHHPERYHNRLFAAAHYSLVLEVLLVEVVDDRRVGSSQAPRLYQLLHELGLDNNEQTAAIAQAGSGNKWRCAALASPTKSHTSAKPARLRTLSKKSPASADGRSLRGVSRAPTETFPTSSDTQTTLNLPEKTANANANGGAFASRHS